MKNIIEIKFTLGRAKEWLRANLEDMVVSLDEELRKNKQGRISGEYKGSLFIVRAEESSVEIIRPYIDAFVRAMRRDGERFLFNIVKKRDNSKYEYGKVEGELINRERLLTKCKSLDWSLKDAARKRI